MKIGILGAGRIGVSIAALLDTAAFVDTVILGDARMIENMDRFPKTCFRQLDALEASALENFVRDCDAIVCAAPYHLNKPVARVCARLDRSYFDLAGDVDTANFVRGLAEGSLSTFMPQCGLAPGAINIIGSGLAHLLKTVRSLEMRVGAFPLAAGNQMKYYLTCSAARLIHEYCRCGEALSQGRRISTLPFHGVEHLTIDGIEYEAFNTSGGVATMCDTFEGRIGELNYKTLRYPGHGDPLKLLLSDLNLSQRQNLLTLIFNQEMPLTLSDVVVVYVNTVGKDKSGFVQGRFVKKIYPQTVQGRSLSAIQLSTAAGAVAAIELFARGHLPAGFVKAGIDRSGRVFRYRMGWPRLSG